MAMDKKSKDSALETFDSGDGPTVPSKFKGDFDHRDSDGGLKSEKGGLDLQAEDN